jgi:hypothetical protein
VVRARAGIRGDRTRRYFVRAISEHHWPHGLAEFNDLCNGIEDVQVTNREARELAVRFSDGRLLRPPRYRSRRRTAATDKLDRLLGVGD